MPKESTAVQLAEERTDWRTELSVLGEVTHLLAPLDSGAKIRILRYLEERFGLYLGND